MANKQSRFNLFTKGKLFFKKIDQILTFKNITRDYVDLNLWGLQLSVSRETTLDTPNELSVILPRAEFRHDSSKETAEFKTEINLNSITIVISPQRQDSSRQYPLSKYKP